MPHLTDIIHYLWGEGLTVREVNGWHNRGSFSFNPAGSVNHHTAGSPNGNAPSLNICINGRAGIPGPLCHFLQSRELDANGLDIVYLIACGRANHAGSGGWHGLTGNSSVWGLEIEHVGTVNEPFPDGRRETAVRVHTACAKMSGYQALMVPQHWQWTSRKPDFVRQLLDPYAFQASIAARLNPPPQPEPPTEDDEMALPESREGRETFVRNAWRKWLNRMPDADTVKQRTDDLDLRIWVNCVTNGQPLAPEFERTEHEIAAAPESEAQNYYVALDRTVAAVVAAINNLKADE